MHLSNFKVNTAMKSNIIYYKCCLFNMHNMTFLTSCIRSGVSGYNPTATTPGFTPASSYGSTPGTSSGSSVVNTNNSGSSTVYGSDNPTGAVSNSLSRYAGWTPLYFVITLAYIRGRL